MKRSLPTSLVVSLAIFFLSPVAGAESSAIQKAAIASARPLATQAGIHVLQQGGNAFDAAVAITAALAVVEPMGSGLGGGGFWLLHRASDGRDIMLDGREKAPAAASETMYQDAEGNVIEGQSLNGALAAAIPGIPAGMVHLSEKYGRLPLRESLKPAIEAAENGFRSYPRFRKLLEFRKPYLNATARRIFLTPEGELPPVGTLIRQPELAATLRRLAIGGRSGFYSGETAEKLVAAVQQAGGIWTRSDLDNYQVIERKPVTGDYHGARIVSASLPSSGGVVLVQILNILAGYDLDAMQPVQRKQKIIEAMKLAYRDRARYLGDADFIEVDQTHLASKDYAARQRRKITDQASPVVQLKPGQATKGEDTTHFSVVDFDGNRVSATLSINYPFGSGMAVKGTGVILNDEMDDFSASPGRPNSYGLVGSKANAIAPGKRPLSSMTPTFVEKGDGVLIIGTPGGSRIISMVLLATLEYLHGNGDLTDWLALGRYHHQYIPDLVQYEPGALTGEDIADLSLMGYNLREREETYGNMHAVLISGKDINAASDPRWSGSAVVIEKGGQVKLPAKTGATHQ
jgi:gamma-glutamyltranspeptidase/glutathione hydrolase